MPVVYKKIQMHIGNVKTNVNASQNKSVPASKSLLNSPMVSRVSGVKPGCACGK